MTAWDLYATLLRNVGGWTGHRGTYAAMSASNAEAYRQIQQAPDAVRREVRQLLREGLRPVRP